MDELVPVSKLKPNPTNPRVLRDEKFVCQTCGTIFTSKKNCATRTPKFCSRSCAAKYNVARPDVKEKMSAAKKGVTPWNKGVNMWRDREHPRGGLGMKYPDRTGANSRFWKGGVTGENELARKSPMYRRWRESVFKRDEYTCVECGKVGGRIQADHIKPFSTHKALRFSISNGRTLCISCHKKTDTYGGKMLRHANR